jgi:phosphoribosylformylglycinamidine cyclo-ligase
VEQLVSGVAEGCVQAGCALIGGETAEMPGFYPEDEYDLAGFSVGIADRPKMIGKDSVAPGDVLLALPSSGLHSNGFSLVRKVFDVENRPLDVYSDELGRTVGEALLEPTRIYVKPVLRCLAEIPVHGLAHITGGGFFENIPRCLPEGMTAKISKSSVRTPPIFRMLQFLGDIPERDMFNTYNMGVGMTAVVAEQDADAALSLLREGGVDAYALGEIVPGDERVVLC